MNVEKGIWWTFHLIALTGAIFVISGISQMPDNPTPIWRMAIGNMSLITFLIVRESFL